MTDMKHLLMAELEAGLEHIRQSPKDGGVLELIVRRPEVDGREVLETGELNPVDGLAGDRWKMRDGSRTAEDSPYLDTQLTIMNARAIALLAQTRQRWPLAGDQLFLDLDLSDANLPPGTRLAIGSAVAEVTAAPHLGCKKFTARFGLDAVKFVNSAIGKELHLRGIYAKVVQAGAVRVGDRAKKL